MITNPSALEIQTGVTLLVGLGYSVDQIIVAAEKAARAQVTDQRGWLPAKGLLEDRSLWEKLGVRIGAIVANDPIWCEVALPEGWQIVPDPDAKRYNWSYVLDARGQRRADLYYTITPGRRRAEVTLLTRFGAECACTDCGSGDCRINVVDRRTGEPVARFTAATKPEAVNAVLDWIERHRPLANDRMAYWEEPWS